jgi:hypothetical protein
VVFGRPLCEVALPENDDVPLVVTEAIHYLVPKYRMRANSISSFSFYPFFFFFFFFFWSVFQFFMTRLTLVVSEEGLFRKSGSAQAIQQLRAAIDATGCVRELILGEADCHAVAGLLKLFVRHGWCCWSLVVVMGGVDWFICRIRFSRQFLLFYFTIFSILTD